MKIFLFLIFFLKAEYRVRPELSLGKYFYDSFFGVSLGLVDDIEIGSYTNFKIEGFAQYELKNNKKIIIRSGIQLELGTKNSIGLKFKVIHKIVELFIMIKMNNQRSFCQFGFGFVKKFHEDYFYEISLGFQKEERNKVINKKEYILNIKKIDEKNFKKQIIHKFIWNNQSFLEENLTPEKLDFLLSQYIKTFNPIFNKATETNLNRILDDVFFEQKKLFNSFFKKIDVESLNKNAITFLNKNIFDFDYDNETKKEFKTSLKDYFQNNGICNDLINRAISYQKKTSNIFLLKPIHENKINFVEIYEKYLGKVLISSYAILQNQIGHIITNQFYNNKKRTVDIQTIKNSIIINIEKDILPVGIGNNCVMYSYYISIFSLLKGDLEKSKKIFLYLYNDQTNLSLINEKLINCNPIKNKRFAEYLYKMLFDNSINKTIEKLNAKINKIESDQCIHNQRESEPQATKEPVSGQDELATAENLNSQQQALAAAREALIADETLMIVHKSNREASNRAQILKQESLIADENLKRKQILEQEALIVDETSKRKQALEAEREKSIKIKALTTREFVFFSHLCPHKETPITSEYFIANYNSLQPFNCLNEKITYDYNSNNTELVNDHMDSVLREIRKRKINTKLHIMYCLRANIENYQELIEKYPIIEELVQDLVVKNDQELFIPILKPGHFFAFYIYRENNETRIITLNSIGIQEDSTSCGFIVLLCAKLASENLLKTICEEQDPIQHISNITIHENKTFGQSARDSILESLTEWGIYDPK
ncbi:hypothetical protein [Alphaproteobacteria bacterium endosymbiont of Tiliacea citrago]|uniref:hypothetical protein n=1 Tax=Alphaproteobacteria bacterium endosymbiont of Tiliacea citrago TaxID=3077944 RepID=UPI00313B2374